jgi:hypothetical protein
MNLYESRYLIEYGISIKEYEKMLSYVANSKYAKVNLPTNLSKTDLRNIQKLVKKFKDADLVKEVKGELRLNPYFYLQPNLENSVIKKLQNDWDSTEPKSYVGDEFITNPITGEVYKVWLEKQKVKFREATMEDFQ